MIYYFKLKKELRRLALSGQLHGKLLCAMGSLNNIVRIDRALRKTRLHIDYGLNNSPSLSGVHRLKNRDYTILTPHELKERYPSENVVIIVFSDHYWLEMTEQLTDMGYDREKNIVVLEACDTPEKAWNVVKRGERCFRRLRGKYGEDTSFFVMVGPMGDNYYFYAYLKAYLQKHRISRYCVLGTKVTQTVAELYGDEEHFHRMQEEMLYSLERYHAFTFGQNAKLKFLQIWDVRFHFNPCRIRLSPDFSFMDSFRYHAFGLDESCVPAFPALTNQEWARQWLARHKVHAGRTVILAPYAYSISDHIPEWVWKTLAEELHSRGYDVLLNAARTRECEKTFSDIPTIDAPIRYMRECTMLSGGLIAMRSGLCDVTGDLNVKKVVLYPEHSAGINYNQHRPDMQFGSIVNMGLCSDAVELEFKKGNQTEAYWQDFMKRVLGPFPPLRA